mgnify:CR=1 FL=1
MFGHHTGDNSQIKLRLAVDNIKLTIELTSDPWVEQRHRSFVKYIRVHTWQTNHVAVIVFKVLLLGLWRYDVDFVTHFLERSTIILDRTRDAMDIRQVIISKKGNLTHWAQQGVLLLNATLSVRASQAGSHQGRGWEQFTDRIIDLLNKERENLVFLLWGSYAQQKGKLIDTRKHLVLKAPHPSPLSSHRGFFGCKHFSKTNELLVKQGLAPIDWKLLTP